jgi:UDP-N-acetylglucosamine acyltransferase
MSIHPTAIIDKQADIDPTAEIGPYVVIDGPVRIGARTRVVAQAYITGWTEIGEDCEIFPGAVLGGPPQDVAYQGERSFCRIGDRTIVREGTTVHRGTGEDTETVVGEECFLMTNSHVGHNCRVGKQVKLVTGTILGGHVIVEEFAFLGGGAGIHQFCRVGELSIVHGLTVAKQDVPPFMLVNREGQCGGINVVGMRRAGYSKAERDEVALAYRLLYRKGLRFRDALNQLADRVETVPGRKIVEFASHPSKRGILSGPRHMNKQED